MKVHRINKKAAALLIMVTAAEMVLSGCEAKNIFRPEQPESYVNMDADEPAVAGTTSDDITSDDSTSDGNISADMIISSDTVSLSIQQSEPERVLPSDAGFHEEAFSYIGDIIERDIEDGFTSAQLAVMRDGKLVYENAWGRVNSYHQDGTRDTESPEVTTETLYDLASLTKMFGVNYALQKLVTDGDISLDSRVIDYLGDRFSQDVIEIDYEDGDKVDITTQREWKSSLTLKDLLMHQGGFTDDPKYCNPHVDTRTQKPDPEKDNLLFAGNGADEETKEATVEAICRTPLLYEPGTRTVYSDVDYMILGLVVEQVTGEDLDTYLKETFLKPMGLTHITYKPLDNGFTREDCAATELNGNTRDGVISFDGIRTYTIQGEVHDEKAWYSMGGISGHAGLFGNATDVARLADVMLTGKHGDITFFSPEVIKEFTGAKSAEYRSWGLGWWRQGDMQRTKYFGSRAGEDTFGHQGWTGTLIMIDPEKKIVIAYLTNKINSPVADKYKDPNEFTGSSYTAATLGFVPEILYTGLDEEGDVTDELQDLRINI